MTIDDFQNKLRDRWREMDMEDVSFIGSELEKYDPEHYEAIYTEFRRSYQYNTPPRVAHIVKAIKELGLKKSFKRTNLPMAYVCSKCKTVYAGKSDDLDAYRCPECLSFNRSVIENPQAGIGEIKTVQTMCLCAYQDYYGGDRSCESPKCPNFGQPRAYGPLCDIFETRLHSQAECRDCICATCCENRRRELEDMRNDRRYQK